MSAAAYILVLCAALAAAPAGPAEQAAAPEAGAGSLRLDPTDVPVTLFFDGTAVHFEAAIPAGAEAAVICAGPPADVELKKKGRVFNLLWMNTGEIVFEQVPLVYIAAATKPIAELASAAELEELGAGYDALAAKCAGAGGERARLFGEFLRLKESEGLYSLSERDAGTGMPSGGSTRFSGALEIPAKMPPGEYAVRLLVFEHGGGRVADTRTLRIARTGAAAFITDLAREHGLLYGILAVVIALAVGLLTGLVFGLGSKGGH